MLYFFGFLVMVYSVLTCFQAYSRSIGSDFFLVWGVNRFNSVSVSENSGNIFSQFSKEKLFESMKKIGEDTGDRELLHALQARPDVNLCATPFLYSVLTPFSQMNFTHARAVFFGTGILALLTGFLILSRLMRTPLSLTFLFMGSVFIFYYPVEMSLSLGNVNELIVFFTIVFYGIQKMKLCIFQKMLEGFCIGLLCFFKPLFAYSVLILFVFYFIQNRKFSGFYILGLCFSLVPALACSFIYFDLFSSWQGWMAYLGTLDIGYWAKSVIYGNFSFRAVLFHVTGYDPSMLQSACWIMAVLIPVLLKKHIRKDSSDLAHYFFWMGYFLFLLSSPLVWYHYFSLLIVPFFCVLSRLNPQSEGKQLFFSLITGLIWVLIGMPYCYESFWKPELLTKVFLFYSSLFILLFFWGRGLLVSPEKG